MNFFPRPTRAEQQLSYEMSDEYFTDHDSPYRASNLLKSAKILIILEDPVKRAFYHYKVGTSTSKIKVALGTIVRVFYNRGQNLRRKLRILRMFQSTLRNIPPGE